MGKLFRFLSDSGLIDGMRKHSVTEPQPKIGTTKNNQERVSTEITEREKRFFTTEDTEIIARKTANRLVFLPGLAIATRYRKSRIRSIANQYLMKWLHEKRT